MEPARITSLLTSVACANITLSQWRDAGKRQAHRHRRDKYRKTSLKWNLCNEGAYTDCKSYLAFSNYKKPGSSSSSTYRGELLGAKSQWQLTVE
jgi:hypothetical protein